MSLRFVVLTVEHVRGLTAGEVRAHAGPCLHVPDHRRQHMVRPRGAPGCIEEIATTACSSPSLDLGDLDGEAVHRQVPSPQAHQQLAWRRARDDGQRFAFGATDEPVAARTADGFSANVASVCGSAGEDQVVHLRASTRCPSLLRPAVAGATYAPHRVAIASTSGGASGGPSTKWRMQHRGRGPPATSPGGGGQSGGYYDDCRCWCVAASWPAQRGADRERLDDLAARPASRPRTPAPSQAGRSPARITWQKSNCECADPAQSPSCPAAPPTWTRPARTERSGGDPADQRRRRPPHARARAISAAGTWPRSRSTGMPADSGARARPPRPASRSRGRRPATAAPSDKSATRAPPSARGQRNQAGAGGGAAAVLERGRGPGRRWPEAHVRARSAPRHDGCMCAPCPSARVPPHEHSART